LIDRAFAEQVAARFDSLNNCNRLYLASSEALQACQQTVSDYAVASELKDSRIKLHKKQAEAMQDIIDSKTAQVQLLNDNVNILTGQLSKVSKRCKRQKFWAVAGGVVTGFVAGAVLGVLAK
jgi:hypothetical protein